MTLVVVGRPGVAARRGGPGWRVEVVDGAGVDVSSSEVRAAGGRRSARSPGLVPEAVEHCIRRRDLYAVGR